MNGIYHWIGLIVAWAGIILACAAVVAAICGAVVGVIKAYCGMEDWVGAVAIYRFTGTPREVRKQIANDIYVAAGPYYTGFEEKISSDFYRFCAQLSRIQRNRLAEIKTQSEKREKPISADEIDAAIEAFDAHPDCNDDFTTKRRNPWRVALEAAWKARGVDV